MIRCWYGIQWLAAIKCTAAVISCWWWWSAKVLEGTWWEEGKKSLKRRKERIAKKYSLKINKFLIFLFFIFPFPFSVIFLEGEKIEEMGRKEFFFLLYISNNFIGTCNVLLMFVVSVWFLFFSFRCPFRHTTIFTWYAFQTTR